MLEKYHADIGMHVVCTCKISANRKGMPSIYVNEWKHICSFVRLNLYIF